MCQTRHTFKATLEYSNGLLGLALAQVQHADSCTRHDQAEGVIDLLSNAHPFFADGHRLAELAHLGQTPDQPGADKCSRQAGHAQALLPELAF